MYDVIYVISTVAFFALMLALVRGLALLGGRDAGAEATDRS